MNLALRPPAAGGAFALSIYLLACLLAAGYAAAGESGADAAQAIHFEILPQPLESALTLFSQAAGYSVLIGGELVRGRMSRGVHGDFAPGMALEMLLEGTGLAVRYIGSKAFTLSPLASGDEGSAGGTVIPGAPEETASTAGADDFSYTVQTAVTRALCAAQPDSFGRYRLGLQLWLARTGKVVAVRLLQSSGAAARDRQVQASLQGMELGMAPPPGLVQPLTILLTPRPDPAADCRYFSGEAR